MTCEFLQEISTIRVISAGQGAPYNVGKLCRLRVELQRQLEAAQRSMMLCEGLVFDQEPRISRREANERVPYRHDAGYGPAEVWRTTLS